MSLFGDAEAPLDMDFSRQSMERHGFNGWLPFEEVRSAESPRTGGVYVVTYGGADPPSFLGISPGGWFKGRDPTIPLESLRANWVSDAKVVYIGKADQLRRRLRQYADFGQGRPVGHWGGRLIWQLADSSSLRVAWKETPSVVPAHAKAKLIELFRQEYAKPPFANAPHRLGR